MILIMFHNYYTEKVKLFAEKSKIISREK